MRASTSKSSLQASSIRRRISVTLNGQDYAQVFGKAAAFVEREAGKDQSALTLRDVVLPQPGTYKVRVTDGVQNSRA